MISTSSISSIPQILFLLAVILLGSSRAADSLFEDPVVARGKGFEIRESDLQEAYVSHKAAAAALGQPAPNALERKLKSQLLDKMIATKLFLLR
ncbi:MAG TPA: hypothetical protein VK633_04200, partial [Verrucomicrobiae bacterium]|nr:hypothetical protein [Verrucomicrobiae bacterium]